LFGDDCGSYAPIQALTKTEVKMLAAWLGVPDELVNKTPIDGLQPLTDEERLGVTYSTIDAYIRSNGAVSEEDENKILSMFSRNMFKLKMVHIDGPKFEFFPDAIRANYGV
jgi:NAD+ synthase